MLSCDLLVIAGAPGSGKTTVADLLRARLESPYIDFGEVREFHLDRNWKTASTREEQMSFENLIYILKNYFRYGYKNVIVTDLQDFRVRQIPELFADRDYFIATLVVKSEEELATRLRNRDSGFRDVRRALAWNEQIQRRPLLVGEQRIDNTRGEPQQAADMIWRIMQGI